MGSLRAHVRPRSWPENRQPQLGEKSSPGGLPMFLHCSRRTPYGWKNRGLYAAVGSGRRGLLVCLHVGQLLPHPAQVSQPHEVGGPLIAGIRCPAGVKGQRGHSPGERGRLALREPLGKSPAQSPSAHVFPAHTVSEGLGEMQGCVAQGKSHDPLGGRVGFHFPR